MKKKQVRLVGSEIEIGEERFRLRAGAIHYFRVHPGQWRDRLTKARQLGLNAVETYFCWNLHEPHPGEFDFSGILDFVRFIEIAQEVGLYVVARPGPYVCGEWEHGGLPAWLPTIPGMRMRRMNDAYLEVSDRYFRRVLSMLRPLQASCGGPIVAIQMENEYGNYCEDKAYLRHLLNLFLESGIDVPLFTADNGYTLGSIEGGSLPELPAAITFGAGDEERCFERLRMLRPDAPLLALEFWTGMFDSWGDREHQRISTEKVAGSIDRILEWGGSFNLYMFCGGTNFGFTNGAKALTEWTDNGRRLTERSYSGRDYTPQTTSYDYDAPLDEAGDPTPKYFAIQEVLKKHFPDASYGTPVPAPKGDYGAVPLTGSAALFDNLDVLGHHSENGDAETMEALGQNFGFILYRTRIESPWIPEEDTVFLREVRDRAMVYFDDRYLGCVERNDGNRIFELPYEGRDGVLSVLVENMGHIHYGPALGCDFKGLPLGVSMVMKSLRDFSIDTLELEDLSGIRWGGLCETVDHPRFYRGELVLDEEPLDTFLKFPGRKGVAWINGFNLGRYWNIGPGDALYVPAPVLRRGRNEIVIFELHDLNAFEVELRPSRNW